MQITVDQWTPTQEGTRALKLEHDGLVLHASTFCEDSDEWTWRVAIWRSEDGPRTWLAQAQSRDTFPEQEAVARATAAAQQLVQVVEHTMAFDAKKERW